LESYYSKSVISASRLVCEKQMKNYRIAYYTHHQSICKNQQVARKPALGFNNRQGSNHLLMLYLALVSEQVPDKFILNDNGHILPKTAESKSQPLICRYKKAKNKSWLF